MEAVEQGSSVVVEILLTHGARVNDRDVSSYINVYNNTKLFRRFALHVTLFV